MLAKKLTNEEAMAQLKIIAANTDAATEFKLALLKVSSFIPLTLASKYRRYANYNDLLQIGFEALWRAINVFDTSKNDNFLGWAFLVTRQAICREALREKKYLDTYILSGLSVGHDNSYEFEEDLLNAQEEKVIKMAIDQLGGEYKSLLLDIYINSRSLRDVGKSMGISHESVRRAKDEAIDHLKRIICPKN